jgi:hypothetical protein
MPLYTIWRHLESGLSEDEFLAVAGLVIGSSSHYPSVRWQRSFQWDDGDQVHSVCVYEGPSAELIRAHSERCAIPFSEIREVREYQPETQSSLRDGWSLFLLTADLSQESSTAALRATVSESTRSFDGGSAVEWIRTFWDRDSPHARRVVAAPDEQAVRRELNSISTPYEVQAVDEALPVQWAEWFDAVGLPHHWEHPEPIDAGPEPAYVR